MILLKEGKDKVRLESLALNHWEAINPLTEEGNHRVDESLIGRLNSVYEEHLKQSHRKEVLFYKWLIHDNYKNLRELILADISIYPSLILKVTSLLAFLGLAENEKVIESLKGELLEKVFQYGNWRSNGKGLALFELLDIEVCPYCNIETIYVDYDKDLLIGTFDHYYDKAIYPYLSLSFYNLVPSCRNCNEVHKKDKNFSIDTHLHPYMDDYNTVSRFECEFVDEQVKYEVNWEVLCDPATRCFNYNNHLGFTARYNQKNVSDQAGLIYRLGQQYTLEQRLEYVEEYGLDLEAYEKQLCENHLIPYAPDEIRNRQYGKLKRDVAIQAYLISFNV